MVKKHIDPSPLIKEIIELQNNFSTSQSAKLDDKASDQPLKNDKNHNASLYKIIRLIADNVPDMIWAKDLDLKYIFVNKATCDILLNAEDCMEPIGKTESHFAEREKNTHPENPDWHTFGEKCIETDKLVMKSQKTQRFDLFGNLKGESVCLDVHKSPFIDGSGKMIGIVGCARIVTKEKQMETENERINQIVLEKERRYETLFKLTPSGIMIEDKQGKILDLNPAFCSSLGYKRSELIGKKVHKLAHPDYLHKVDKNIRAILSGKILKHVEKSVRKDGSSCYMELKETKMILPDGNEGILCVAEDISERRRTEQELVKKNKQLENLLTTAGHLTSQLGLSEVLDEIGTGAVDILNTQSCTIYLLEPDQKTLNPVIAIDPEFKNELLSTPLKIDSSLTGLAVKDRKAYIFNKAKSEPLNFHISGTSNNFDERIIVTPMIVDDKVLGAMCLSRIGSTFVEEELSLAETYAAFAAITLKNAQLYNKLELEVEERKQAEKSLYNLNLQYEAFIQNNIVGIWKVSFSEPISINSDPREIALNIYETGFFSDCNEAFLKMYRITKREELLGKKIKEISVEQKVTLKRLTQFVRNDFKVEILDNEEKDLNGNIRYFRNSYFGMVDKDKLQYMWGIQTDITETKKLEQQLIHSQKLEAVGTLAGGVAHDFNNLLTVINGHAELSIMKLEKTHPHYKDFVSILNAGRKAEILTRQLLAFSRKQIIKPMVININDLIRNWDKMLQGLIGEDIVLQKNLTEDDPLIKADHGQIEQILVNLIFNARDAIIHRYNNDKQKQITIQTDKVYLDETFVNKHPGSQPGWHLLFSIHDTGIGINKKIIDKIFEPFFTTKAKERGTGLGLAVVYGIVKQNKGNIFVSSEPGRGSTINIYWPATNDQAERLSGEQAVKDEIGGNETILLVEDDDDVRTFTHIAFRQLGYQVYTAENGKDALELIKTKDLEIDLLITDLIMPEMNGRELVQHLKNKIQENKVIYVSGYTDKHIVHKGLLNKNVNFIQKPFSVKAIAEKVRAVLDNHQGKTSKT